MTLPYREERLLRRVDHALRRSDPDLASLLSIFARLTISGFASVWCAWAAVSSAAIALHCRFAEPDIQSRWKQA